LHGLKTDKKAAQSADILYLVEWAHANRKRLIVWVVSVVVAITAISGYMWQRSARETNASEAYSQLKGASPMDGKLTSSDAQAFLNLADSYQGTGAAALARLRAAGILFEAGDYAKARAQYEQFLQSQPGYPLAPQAALGIAACLEGEGKPTEAISRYEEFAKRHPNDPTIVQAKTALGRLYQAQNKPEQAMKVYQELAAYNPNDSWVLEASIRSQDLALQNPNLKSQTQSPTLNIAPASTDKK
jgi:tetratricopeptide (TPR) repeat protein